MDISELAIDVVVSGTFLMHHRVTKVDSSAEDCTEGTIVDEMLIFPPSSRLWGYLGHALWPRLIHPRVDALPISGATRRDLLIRSLLQETRACGRWCFEDGPRRRWIVECQVSPTPDP